MQNFFVEIGIIITLASVLGYLLKLMKQPLIPAYVLAGLIICPVLGLITNSEAITTLSDIGIAFLLFIVGLEINFRKLKEVGSVAIFGGFINSSLLFALGFLVATVMGFITKDALYLGLVIAFGSTMVVVKLLSDKKELDTLHGRILVGILLMEDLISVLVLSALSNGNIFISFLKFGGLLAAAYLLGRFALPSIFRNAAKHPELLFLISLSTCFTFAIFALVMGISMAIGAFLAGLTIANLPYKVEIISRVRSLRDFFATIFFVSLGMQVSVATLGAMIIPFIGFFILVSVAKPFIVMNTVSMFGYNRKVSFLSAISLAQISEFALIITALGRSLGQISEGVFTLAILLAISTITMSSYLLKYDTQLFHLFEKKLHFLDRWDNGMQTMDLGATVQKDVVVCGYNRIGYNIVKGLKENQKSYIVVDYNPETIKELASQGIPCTYGDIGDIDVLERLGLSDVSMVVSTVPDVADSTLLIRKTRELNKTAAIIVTASQLQEALALYNEGADYVVLPHFLGGEHVSKLIADFHDNPINIIIERLKHIEELQIREELGHEHPQHE